MKQGRMLALLALVALLALGVTPATRAEAVQRKPAATAASAHKKSAALHQFSGTVTALDKGSLTVEKGGASAKSMVFTRSPETKTSGELAKDARVTVWYRDEDGRLAARKVVVKTTSADTAR
jgi:hypothetical protein